MRLPRTAVQISTFALAAMCHLRPSYGEPAAPAQPDRAKGIRMLEEAYAILGQPAVLLSIASAYSEWEGHCGPARQAYDRFFAACRDCPFAQDAVDEYEALEKRCLERPLIDAIGIAASERRKNDPLGIDALARIIQLSERVAPDRTLRLRESLAIAGHERDVLNSIRPRVWAIFQEQPIPWLLALELLDPLLGLDEVTFRHLGEKLEVGRKEQAAVNLADLTLGYLEEPQAPGRLARLARRMNSCLILPGDLYGWVNIDSKPSAQVYFGEHLLGETPMAKVRLPAGCVSVRTVEIQSKRERSIDLTVVPNKTSRFQVDLQTPSD